jgi:hypothetical protein
MNFELLNEMLECFKANNFSSFVAECYELLNANERTLWHRLRTCEVTIEDVRYEQMKLFTL